MSFIENARMLRPLLVDAAQSADDATALRMTRFYPKFEDVIGSRLAQGYKFTWGGKLWRVVQGEMIVQPHFVPGVGTESLYEEICLTHEGTAGDPIPYTGNMTLENGKYYMQNNKVYLCIRDTGSPVYHPLAELAGLYVQVLTK